MSPARAAALVLLLTPFLAAAADPAGDVAPCPGAPGRGVAGVTGEAPDLVAIRGEIAELGTSAVWTLTFQERLQVPDERGHPFRIDIVVRDPDVVPVTFAFYRGLNRLVRYDAVRNATLTVLLIPERSQERFTAPEIEGRTMTIRVPGRILSADEDESGTSPGLERLRWGVIVRDQGSCDLLRDGRPSEAFEVEGGTRSGTATDSEVSGEVTDITRGTPRWIWVALTVVLVGGLLAYALRRRDAGG